MTDQIAARLRNIQYCVEVDGSRQIVNGNLPNLAAGYIDILIRERDASRNDLKNLRRVARSIVDHPAFDHDYLSKDLSDKLNALNDAVNDIGDPNCK